MGKQTSTGTSFFCTVCKKQHAFNYFEGNEFSHLRAKHSTNRKQRSCYGPNYAVKFDLPILTEEQFQELRWKAHRTRPKHTYHSGPRPNACGPCPNRRGARGPRVQQYDSCKPSDPKYDLDRTLARRAWQGSFLIDQNNGSEIFDWGGTQNVAFMLFAYPRQPKTLSPLKTLTTCPTINRFKAHIRNFGDLETEGKYDLDIGKVFRFEATGDVVTAAKAYYLYPPERVHNEFREKIAFRCNEILKGGFSIIVDGTGVWSTGFHPNDCGGAKRVAALRATFFHLRIEELQTYYKLVERGLVTYFAWFNPKTGTIAHPGSQNLTVRLRQCDLLDMACHLEWLQRNLESEKAKLAF